MNPTNVTLNLTEEAAKRFFDLCKNFKEIEPSAEYIKWEGWKDSVKITLYKTNKLVLQSKNQKSLEKLKKEIIEFLYENDETMIGIDEAGRSELKGPFVICATIGNESNLIELRDSKKTKNLKNAFEKAKNKALGFVVFVLNPELIDQLRGKGKSLNKIEHEFIKSIAELNKRLELGKTIMVDGQPLTDEKISVQFIPKGDDKVAIISAASILAKYFRDFISNEEKRKSWKNYKVEK